MKPWVKLVGGLFVGSSVLVSAMSMATADHVLGSADAPLHWPRLTDPVVVQLGDSVSSEWDKMLDDASFDWNNYRPLKGPNFDTHLTTEVIRGANFNKNIDYQNGGSCAPYTGRVEVCNYIACWEENYIIYLTLNCEGWLGVATLTYDPDNQHIAQATVDLNDFYFDADAFYKLGWNKYGLGNNDYAAATDNGSDDWRQYVMCQEIAHAFGLDHQDEQFDNPNLGSCMDYTADVVDAHGDNTKPNIHDFDQINIIYEPSYHNDGGNQNGCRGRGCGGGGKKKNNANANAAAAAFVGHTALPVNASSKAGHVFVRELADGTTIVSFVIWATDERPSFEFRLQ